MKSLKSITPKQIDCIKNQEFSDFSPATLLKDFSMLLKFIGAEGIEVSKTNHFFAIKHLSQINELMTHPLDINLKRPQQKSFPHIHGLYLLLRASGLTYLKIEKKCSRLLLNQVVLASWETLNAIERYFALFEAWWFRGSTEIIGERDRYRINDSYLYDSIVFFDSTLKKGLDSKNYPGGISDYVRYRPGHHYLALMELFGFIKIELNSTACKDNWPIVKIKPTLLGNTIFRLFSSDASNLEQFLLDFAEEQPEIEPADEIKKYRPDLKNALALPEFEFLDNACVIFKVSLGKAIRTLSVPTTISLDELTGSILDAFDFDNDHLYEFSYKNVYGLTETIVHPNMESEYGMYTPEYLVGEMPLIIGMEVTFLFDFGDNWQFSLIVESIDTEGPHLSSPKVIKRQGNSPEQYPGYDDF